jgi:hypothetical protein
MFNKHVYYHIFPRYEQPNKLSGEECKDENWPGIPTLMGNTISDRMAEEIINTLRNNI